MKRIYEAPTLDMITLTLKDVILSSGDNESKLDPIPGGSGDDELDDLL